MTNPINWPNPERPGVPMFPEREGRHLLRISGFVEACRWRPLEKAEEWMTAMGKIFSSAGLARPGVAEYIGPVLTPTQIAELLAGERERCCDIVANRAPGNFHDLPERDAQILTNMAEDICEAIRSLGAAP